MAKKAGAVVTGVDNALKQDFIRSLGADRLIDFEQSDYTKTDAPYDLILDLACDRSMFAIRRAVASGGRCSVVGGSVTSLLSAATLGRLLSTGERTIGVLIVRPNKEDLLRLVEMVTTQTLRVPIERTFALDEVALALSHLGHGRALGKLVIELG
jgi:NADPH:quinone reductase-like Zn-dependent oxidoreductase